MRRPILKRTSFACIALVALQAGAPAAGAAETDNPLILSGSGVDNLLQIDSVAPPSSRPPEPATDGNRATLHIEGDFNGGWGLSWPETPLFSGQGAPGLIRQTGLGNIATLSVAGDHNLFSVVQNGSTNIVSGRIAGSGNMAAVMQQGQGNMASFAQVGTGNSLAITQSSW